MPPIHLSPAPEGGAVTIQSTGMGGPSAAIVVEELIDLGARVLIRTGTCGALDGGLELGELVTAGEVISPRGARRAPGRGAGGGGAARRPRGLPAARHRRARRRRQATAPPGRARGEREAARRGRAAGLEREPLKGSDPLSG